MSLIPNNKMPYGRRCPNCKIVLLSALYEGQSVGECPSCHGYLVKRMKLRLIQRRELIPVAMLKEEALNQHAGSSKGIIYCPRCRDTMIKTTVSTPLGYQYDHCKRCDHIWFDGGELALDQLLFQFGLVGNNLKQIKARAEQLLHNTEQREEFERLLAAIPLDQSETTSETDLVAKASRELFHFILGVCMNHWSKRADRTI